jgi:hypothetical protein
VKPFKIKHIENDRYLVLVEGEEKPLHFEVGGNLPRDQAIRKISYIILSRQTRKHLDSLSASIARADEILIQLAQDKTTAPPAIAEALISMFAPKRFSDAQLGDMQEIFETNVKRHGSQRARRLYWYEVARSIGPIILHWLKRIGFIAVLVDYGRKKMGL